MNSAVSKPALSDLRAFMAVAEYRSFRRAAELLGVTRSSLSHAVRAVEERLAVRLLHRTTRRVSLTEAGEGQLGRRDTLLSALDQDLGAVARKSDVEVKRGSGRRDLGVRRSIQKQ